MTKATLKHVANQYILIVDEEPNIGDWYFSTNTNKIKKYKDGFSFPAWRKIIAAENLDGVKGIMIERNDNLIVSAQQYALSSNRTDCITKIMNAYLDGFDQAILYKSIDTEVEVTEEEDYWVVRL